MRDGAQARQKAVAGKLEKAQGIVAEEKRKRDLKDQQERIRVQFAARLNDAEKANSDGRPDDAVKILDNAKSLLNDPAAFQAELNSIATRTTEYRKAATDLAQARERQAVTNARATVAGKIKAGDLRAAFNDADNAGKTNPAVRTDLRDVLECLRILQKMKTAIADVDTKLPDIDKRLKARAPKERGDLLTARKALETTLNDTAGKLSTPDFKDAPALAKNLPEAKCAELGQLLVSLDSLSKKAVDDSPPNEVPTPPDKRKPDPKPPVTPDKKPPKTDPVGEKDPFTE